MTEAGETLTWLDREGRETAASVRKGSHDIDSRLAPDGQSLALEVTATETSPITVWIHDLERDVRTALTPGLRATFPVWSPDSRQVALRLADGIEPQGIYVLPVDRSEPPRLVLAEPEDLALLPMDGSVDGERLLYVQSPTTSRQRSPENGLWSIEIAGGDPEVFLDSPGASEVDARYSPDGHWVVYRSDQSGQYEIYLRPAAGGGEIRVSADGGSNPEWNPAGGELFFLRGLRGRELLTVEVRDSETRPVGAEQMLLQLPQRARQQFLFPAADGQRFIASLFGDTDQVRQVHAIFDWRRDPER